MCTAVTNYVPTFFVTALEPSTLATKVQICYNALSARDCKSHE